MNAETELIQSLMNQVKDLFKEGIRLQEALTKAETTNRYLRKEIEVLLNIIK